MVTLDGNTLYIYGVIAEDWDGNRVDEQVNQALSILDGQDVDVRINSPGGDAFMGFAIYNALLNYSGRVRTINDGLAASAGSLIFLAGSDRIMNTPAMIMVHGPWSIAIGNSDAMLEAAEYLSNLSDEVKAAYMQATGLNEETVSSMLSKDTWLTTERATELGFVTSTEEVEEPKLKVEMSIVPDGRYENTPKQFLKPKNELHRIKRRPSAAVAASMAKLEKNTGISLTKV